MKMTGKMIRLFVFVVLSLPLAANADEWVRVVCNSPRVDHILIRKPDYLPGWDYCACARKHSGHCSNRAKRAYKRYLQYEKGQETERMIEAILGAPSGSENDEKEK